MNSPANFKNVLRTVAGIGAQVALPILNRKPGEPSRLASKLQRLVVHSKMQRAKWSGNETAAKDAIEGWWTGEAGDDYYDQEREKSRFEQVFQGPHFPMFGQLKAMAETEQFSTLLEIGCGRGILLEYLANELTTIGRFVGIDISKYVIEQNVKQHAGNARLTFEHANVLDWLLNKATDNMILFSNFGVVEYLSQSEFETMLTTLGKKKNVAAAFIEPQDLSLQGNASRFNGTDALCYAHNHAYLLTQAGFDVIFNEDVNAVGMDWKLIVGTKA